MKFTATLLALAGSASAFAPAQVSKTTTSLNVSYMFVFCVLLGFFCYTMTERKYFLL